MATSPKNAQDLFNHLVPEGLRQFPNEAHALNAIYCFKVTGEEGGEWTVDCSKNPPSCTKGDNGKAQCTVKLSSEDLNLLLGNPNASLQLYFQGRLHVSGDLMMAMKLQQLFEIVRPK